MKSDSILFVNNYITYEYINSYILFVNDESCAISVHNI